VGDAILPRKREVPPVEGVEADHTSHSEMLPSGRRSVTG
jgi:hypothetical protein